MQLYDSKFKCNKGESQEEVRKRMYRGIKNILKTYCKKNIVIISHSTAITFLLMKWCKLVDADSKTKKRTLYFKNKKLIDGEFKCPEIFKLTFNNYDLVEIYRIENDF